MHCDLVTCGYEYNLISSWPRRVVNVCQCHQHRPRAQPSRRNMVSGKSCVFNSVVAVSFCSVESGGMAPRGEHAVLLRIIHNIIVILQLLHLYICVPECLAMGE